MKSSLEKCSNSQTLSENLNFTSPHLFENLNSQNITDQVDTIPISICDDKVVSKIENSPKNAKSSNRCLDI